VLKAIKVRLYPSADQEICLGKLFGCSRFVYNKCLNFKINEHKETKKTTSFGELGKFLTYLKVENEWMKESHSKVLQQTVRNLDQAYKNFFREKKGFPKFKSKHDKHQSVRFPNDAISGIKGNRINIIKPLSNIYFKCSSSDESYLNKHQDEIKSGTLSKSKSGKYYFSILVDRPNKTLKFSDNAIGLDLGIKYFIVTSEGQKYENLKLKRNNKTKLIRLYRQLSKKQKGSNNKNRARIRLAKYHDKINNQKEYYLHEVVNQILGENQTIGIENLNVKGLLKNHKLAKSIQEVSWTRFNTILKYKAEWYGRQVIEVNQFFASSKLCNVCGYKKVDLILKDRSWICPDCGKNHDRDINAANNIKQEVIKIKIGLSSPESTLQESKYIISSVNEESNRERIYMIK